MLTVVERVGSDRHGRSTWRFRCDCGGEVVRSSLNLYHPRTHNCGCYRPQNFKKGRMSNRKTHGLSETPLYSVWESMKQRCLLPTSKAYKNYGGRGIYVCEEWRTNYMAFHEWCMANGYERGLDIDRTDNDGPYAPWNCRFVTRLVNVHNRRGSKPLNLGPSVSTGKRDPV